MYSITAIVAAALLSVVNADFSGDASAVIETASIPSSLVAGWDKGKGLNGALAIQETYDPLSKAVEALDSSAGSVEVNEGNVKALSDLAVGISGLLGELTNKAGDFSAVGASQIVQGDITNLAGPSGEIVSKVYEQGKGECNYISSLVGPLSSLNVAFESAASAFSAKAPTFPDLKCEAAEPSSGASSGASSAPSASTSTASETASVSEKPSSSSTSVASANGAIALGANAMAFAAALLI